ncbi:unnamed protein product, partial [Gulo gulo]
MMLFSWCGRGGLQRKGGRHLGPQKKPMSLLSVAVAVSLGQGPREAWLICSHLLSMAWLRATLPDPWVPPCHPPPCPLTVLRASALHCLILLPARGRLSGGSHKGPVLQEKPASHPKVGAGIEAAVGAGWVLEAKARGAPTPVCWEQPSLGLCHPLSAVPKQRATGGPGRRPE